MEILKLGAIQIFLMDERRMVGSWNTAAHVCYYPKQTKNLVRCFKLKLALEFIVAPDYLKHYVRRSICMKHVQTQPHKTQPSAARPESFIPGLKESN